MKIRPIYPIASTVLLVASCIALYFGNRAPLSLAVAGLIALNLALLAELAGSLDPLDIDSESPEAPGLVQVDPWGMQAALMAASDQELPQFPRLTKSGVLYAALVMEEAGETFEEVANLLFDSDTSAFAIAHIFQSSAQHLGARAVRIRDLLKFTTIERDLTDSEAVGLFDGVTDIAVVNSGMALAFGLDGAAGYAEVGGSNLSKRNPATGKIDKTPDGKWIKGGGYRAPDLLSVLELTRAEREHELRMSRCHP